MKSKTLVEHVGFLIEMLVFGFVFCFFVICLFFPLMFICCLKINCFFVCVRVCASSGIAETSVFVCFCLRFAFFHGLHVWGGLENLAGGCGADAAGFSRA